MSDTSLVVEIREQTGKGFARKMRADGRIPGVFYGREQRAIPVSLDPRSLHKVLTTSATGINTLIDLSVAGGGDVDGKTVLVKELQRDPVNGRMLHADFYAVDMTHTIEVAVPIHLHGKAPGVEMGGIVDHALRELDLECLPRAIPDEIGVDIGGLEIGDSLHVRDLILPVGVILHSDPDLSVVSVVAPIVEEEAPAEGAAAVAEGEEGAVPGEGAEGGDDKAESGGERAKGE